MKKEIFCEGEVILGGWSRKVETSHGVTDGYIKLYLPDDAMLDILARLSDEDLRGNKKSGGKLFYLRLNEYDGTYLDNLSEMTFDAPPEPKRLSQIAAIIGSDIRFRYFAVQVFGLCIKNLKDDGKWLPFEGTKNTPENNIRANTNAATLIRYICSIDSRKQLDEDANASAIFKDLIQIPFDKFLEQPK